MRAHLALPVGAILSLTLLAAPAAHASSSSYFGRFHSISTLASTVPANGDLNPYGVAVVPRSTGSLVRGNVLVSNFNASSNLQGTGTTIVQVSPSGQVSLFAQITPTIGSGCPGGIGLTTALVVLRSGWVVVGSLPTTDGTPATVGPGCLFILNSTGAVKQIIAGHGINGPWDMTASDHGAKASLFVTNVLNGTQAAGGEVVDGGTVLRIDLSIHPEHTPGVRSITAITSGFPERTDPAALVIGPTGVALGRDGTLYVADSLENRIAAVPDALSRSSSAGTGTTVSAGGMLNDPLGMALAPNGDILTVNGADGYAVETTPEGKQIASALLDDTGTPPGSGTLFGQAVVPGGHGLYFVDDGSNTLNLFH